MLSGIEERDRERERESLLFHFDVGQAGEGVQLRARHVLVELLVQVLFGDGRLLSAVVVGRRRRRFCGGASAVRRRRRRWRHLAAGRRFLFGRRLLQRRLQLFLFCFFILNGRKEANQLGTKHRDQCRHLATAKKNFFDFFPFLVHLATSQNDVSDTFGISFFLEGGGRFQNNILLDNCLAGCNPRVSNVFTSLPLKPMHP